MKEPLLLKSYLKSLKLPAMLAQYVEVARQCTETDASYEEFLERLAERELAARQATATERRLRQAGFPTAKDLAEFDFAAVPKLNKKRVLDLAGASSSSNGPTSFWSARRAWGRAMWRSPWAGRRAAAASG